MQNYGTLDNHYNIIRFLGRGTNSKVYLVTNINDNNQYAAKIEKEQNHFGIKFEKFFKNELQMATMASGLNNPNIINLKRHGVGTLNNHGKITNNVHYWILEYCPNGDLEMYSRLGRFTERQAKYIFKKILLGVQALHDAGYCHRDLKLNHILLDQNFSPKITGFLFTTLFKQNNQPIELREFLGALRNLSPQIHLHRPYNGEKADIFNLGQILINLVTSRDGFYTSVPNDDCYKFIVKKNFVSYWNHWDNFSKDNNKHYSEDFKDLYISMISFKENDRPTIVQILNHHWFDEINNLDAQQLNELELDVRNEFLTRRKEVIQFNELLILAHNNDDDRDNR